MAQDSLAVMLRNSSILTFSWIQRLLLLMVMTLTPPQLRSLPKIDLHRHLDCSMRWSTVVEIARDLKLDLEVQAAASRCNYLITDPMLNLNAVLKKFLNTQKVLASEEILERLAYEVCEDAFNENILILELRFAPTFILEGHPHLKAEKVISAFQKGLKKAETKFQMATGLIGILQRIKPVSEAIPVMDLFCDLKSEFVGVDLADNEEGFNPLPFAPLFQKAKKAGLRVTVHSGEAPHPQAGQWILDSIQQLGAERIGHGVQAIHHPEVLQILQSQKISLEVCPLSNYLTQVFPNHESHPLRKLIEANLVVTLGSDDPGVFGSCLTDDYILAQNYHGITPEEFKKLNQNAYQASFIAEAKKKNQEHFFYD